MILIGSTVRDRVTGVEGVVEKIEEPRGGREIFAGRRFGSTLPRELGARDHSIVTLKTPVGHFLRVDSERLDLVLDEESLVEDVEE